MSGYVAHGDSYCTVITRDGELPVELIGFGPLPQPGKPIVGVCRNCGQRGTVYEVPPVDPATAAASDAFAEWLADAVNIRMRNPVVGAHATAHQQLLQIHARTEAVTLPGSSWAPPVRVQQCRECRGDGWPCRTLRIVAAGHRHSWPGWREEWSA
ncbi:hypothetical protein [Nonomuraea glycinis]|uniref:hypothetical protein n=1 Tax=Nonomuraea glycinis TaxID=2047744 RepID=UPI00339FB02D